jgi:hypothetical protein
MLLQPRYLHSQELEDQLAGQQAYDVRESGGEEDSEELFHGAESGNCP